MVKKSTQTNLIIHADDLGLQYCFNHGILKGHQEGLLTSTCLRANGLALDHALTEVIAACPQLGIGAHICLNEGQSTPSLQIQIMQKIYHSWQTYLKTVTIKGLFR